MPTLRESGTRYRKIGDLIFDRRSYEIRHDKTGETLFSVDELPYDRLDESTIRFTVPYTPQDCLNQTGLAADSTDIKFTSTVRYRLNARHLKKITLRATWTASHPDSMTRIRLMGTVSGEIVGMSGNFAVDAEHSATAGWSDGELIYIDVIVTTASATAGATTSLVYAIVELEYGIR